VAASQSTSGKDEKQETSHFNKYEGMSDIGHFMVTTAIHTAISTTTSHGYHRPPSHTAITDRHLTQPSPNAISHSDQQLITIHIF
jgi:hypothetical protein